MCEYRLSNFLNLLGYYYSKSEFYHSYTYGDIFKKEKVLDITGEYLKNFISLLDKEGMVVESNVFDAYKYLLCNILEQEK